MDKGNSSSPSAVIIEAAEPDRGTRNFFFLKKPSSNGM